MSIPLEQEHVNRGPHLGLRRFAVVPLRCLRWRGTRRYGVAPPHGRRLPLRPLSFSDARQLVSQLNRHLDQRELDG